MKYIVYLTTNIKSKINGINRIYIGVHKTKDPNIFDGYIGCGVHVGQPSTYMYPKTPFQYAVKKYGTDSFQRSILYVFDNEEDAYNKEFELVDLEFIQQEHVYNIALGGKYLKKQCNKLNQFNLNGELIKTWDSYIDICDFYGYDEWHLRTAIDRKRIFVDSYWSFDNSINISEYSNIKHGSPVVVYLYTKDGKMMQMFDSIKECAEYLGLKLTTLSNGIKREQLFLKKYYVSTKLVDKFEPCKKTVGRNADYYVYKNKEFIGKYTGKNVMNVINLHSWRDIYDSIKLRNGWYKDFYISYTPVDEIPDKISNKSRRIDIYNKYGDFIESIDTIKEVLKKYNIKASKLRSIELGDKYVGDYIFKYHK